MTIESVATLLVLGAALAHACWNLLVKLGEDPMLAVGMLTAAMTLAVLPAGLATGLPAPESWPMLAVSALVHQFYFLLLALGYRWGDLGYVYPLSRGGAPVLIAGLALLAAGERLAPVALAGVLTAAAGIALLAAGGQGGGRATLLALLNACVIAAYTVADGIGVRLSGGGLAYPVWSLLASAAPFALLVLVWRRRALLATARRRWRAGLSAGLLAAGAYGTVIWAMGVLPMAMVSAMRESSVLIAAILGAVILREPPGRRRIAAAALVVAGLAVMKLPA